MDKILKILDEMRGLAKEIRPGDRRFGNYNGGSRMCAQFLELFADKIELALKEKTNERQNGKAL